MALQRGEIGEVGDAWQADHRHVQGLPLPSSRKVLGEAVLFIQIQLHPGHHPYHRHMGQLLQLGQTGAEDLHVAPEFVDDSPLHHSPLIRLQQGHGPVKGSKDTAPVDVTRQQHRRPRHPGHPHIHDVLRLQVDLCGAAGPLQYDDIVGLGQGVVGLQNSGNQLLFVGQVGSGGHAAHHLPVDDHLAPHIAGGLEQDGIHPHRGLHAGRLRLHHLGPPHLQSLPGDETVQRHILALEGSHRVPVLPEDTAQPRRQNALSRIGHGPLDHNGSSHGKPPSPAEWPGSASDFPRGS